MYERIPMPTRRRFIPFVNFFIVFTCKLVTLYSKQLWHLLDMYVYVDAMYSFLRIYRYYVYVHRHIS